MDIMSFLAENFDLPILDWIAANLHSGAMDFLAPILSLFAEAGILYIALSVLFLALPKTRRMGLCTGLALLFGVVLCNMIMKPLVARPRPFDYQLIHFGKEISLLVKAPKDFSFPSGHTIAAFEFAVAAWLNDKRIGIPAFVVAILVAFSRMYLYVHYPSDVIFAAILGTLLAFLGTYLGKRIYRKFEKKAL